MKKINIIEINDLEKIYSGDVRALNKINIDIEHGDFFGLLGPNGAGKTTTIGILTGLVNLTSGSVKVDGHDIIKEYKKTRSKIGLSPQEINLDVFFTIKEILTFQGGYYGLNLREAQKRAIFILEQLGLSDKQNSKARQLSGGMKRRVQIAKALMHNPEILILDEPTAGVDIELRYLLWDLLLDMNKKENKTILLTTHYIEEAEYLCNKVAIIDEGEIIARGSPKELIENLGESFIIIKSDNFDKSLLKEFDATINNDMIKIKSGNPENDLPIIIDILSKNKVSINQLKIDKASLEDVFIKLTGKKIS